MMAVVGEKWANFLEEGGAAVGRGQRAAQSPALFISVDQTSAGLREIQLIHT